MRILIWGKSFPRMGGVERFVGYIAPALIQRGHEVMVLADGLDAAEVSRSHSVTFAPISAALLARDPIQIMACKRRVSQIVADFDPDIIHFQHGGLDHFMLLQQLRIRSTPYVVTLHGDLDELHRMPTTAAVLGQAAAATSVSRHISHHGMNHLDAHTILNAIPEPGQVAYPPRASRILALGRLAREKGFDTLLQAMPLVREAVQDASLTLAGRGPDAEELADLVDRLDLGGFVEMRDWIHPEEVHSAMSASDVVVMPSTWQEPFGLVALETAWAGRPCIASNVGGLPEIVDHDTTGLLVPPGDSEALADAIIRLLQNQPMAEKMGLAGRKRAEKLFDFEAMIDAYCGVFEKVTQAR